VTATFPRGESGSLHSGPAARNLIAPSPRKKQDGWPAIIGGRSGGLLSITSKCRFEPDALRGKGGESEKKPNDFIKVALKKNSPTIDIRFMEENKSKDEPGLQAPETRHDAYDGIKWVNYACEYYNVVVLLINACSEVQYYFSPKKEEEKKERCGSSSLLQLIVHPLKHDFLQMRV